MAYWACRAREQIMSTCLSNVRELGKVTPSIFGCSTLVSPAVTGIVCLWQLRLDRVITISCVFPRFNVRFTSAAHDEACASSDCMVEALEAGTIRYPWSAYLNSLLVACLGFSFEMVTTKLTGPVPDPWTILALINSSAETTPLNLVLWLKIFYNPVMTISERGSSASCSARYPIIWLVITPRGLNYYHKMPLYRYSTKICTTKNLLRSTTHDRPT